MCVENKKKKNGKKYGKKPLPGAKVSDNIIIELCLSLQRVRRITIIIIKNLYNNKLSRPSYIYTSIIRAYVGFFGEKIGLFYCVRVISTRSWHRRGGGDRLSFGYLVSAHGACPFFFFCTKKHFPARRVRKFDFFFYCCVIIIFYYYFSTEPSEKNESRNTIFRKFSPFFPPSSHGRPPFKKTVIVVNGGERISRSARVLDDSIVELTSGPSVGPSINPLPPLSIRSFISGFY